MTQTPSQFRQRLSAVVTFAVGLYLVVGAADATMQIAAEAGFSELEPISFSFQREGPTLRYTSSRARVFYNFQPADHDATAKPLFVFINGGPGCPTCEGLLSTNTGPRSMYMVPWGPTPFLDTTSPNPYSWTRLGNLLYIDAPTTGYSYNLADGIRTGSETAVFYDAQNFNPYIDAAQMVRVVLRFLRAHPDIAKNPVVLVGESYGGTRVSTMLSLLLNYQRYGSGADVYRDVELTREVQRYLDKHFNTRSGRIHAPSAIARQFGHQILIQPQLTGGYQSEITGALYEQPGSVIYALAAAHGKTFTPCADGCNPTEHAVRFVMSEIGYSPYDTGRTMLEEGVLTVWLWAHMAFVGPVTELFGYDVTHIAGLYKDNRNGAYHLKVPGDPLSSTLNLDAIPPAQRPWIEALPETILDGQTQLDNLEFTDSAFGSLFPAVFGALQSPDQHYVSCPPLDAFNAFYANSATRAHYDINPESVRYGRIFLENLPLVKTMITDAGLDVMVYTPSLAPSLTQYSDLVKTAVARRDCPDCDGTIEVKYKATAIFELRRLFSLKQTIWFPRYPVAGHAVSAGMPEKFMGDVASWMAGVKP